MGSIFEEVNLYTAEGEFVATVTIPIFKREPHEPMVLVWDERFFIPNDGEKGFYETFAYHIPRV